MKGSVIIAATAISALAVAGCGSSGSSASGGGSTLVCRHDRHGGARSPAPVAVLGQEQLHFAQLRPCRWTTQANKTKISLVQGGQPS